MRLCLQRVRDALPVPLVKFVNVELVHDLCKGNFNKLYDHLLVAVRVAKLSLRALSVERHGRILRDSDWNRHTCPTAGGPNSRSRQSIVLVCTAPPAVST